MSKQDDPVTIVTNALDDDQEVELITNKSGLYYPSKVELVRNGVILWNTQHTRVFSYQELAEIIQGTHNYWTISQ